MVQQMARAWKHPDSGIYYVRRLIDSRVWVNVARLFTENRPLSLNSGWRPHLSSLNRLPGLNTLRTSVDPGACRHDRRCRTTRACDIFK
jgi:hypothetical protein